MPSTRDAVLKLQQQKSVDAVLNEGKEKKRNVCTKNPNKRKAVVWDDNLSKDR